MWVGGLVQTTAFDDCAASVDTFLKPSRRTVGFVHASWVVGWVVGVVVACKNVDEPLNRRQPSLCPCESHTLVVEAVHLLPVMGVCKLFQFPSSSPTDWTSAWMPMLNDVNFVARSIMSSMSSCNAGIISSG